MADFSVWSSRAKKLLFFFLIYSFFDDVFSCWPFEEALPSLPRWKLLKSLIATFFIVCNISWYQHLHHRFRIFEFWDLFLFFMRLYVQYPAHLISVPPAQQASDFWLNNYRTRVTCKRHPDSCCCCCCITAVFIWTNYFLSKSHAGKITLLEWNVVREKRRRPLGDGASSTKPSPAFFSYPPPPSPLPPPPFPPLPPLSWLPPGWLSRQQTCAPPAES